MLLYFEGFLFGGNLCISDLGCTVDVVFEERQVDTKNINLCHERVDFFAPRETDIISALMFGMEHSGRDESIEFFHCLIVVDVAYCL